MCRKLILSLIVFGVIAAFSGEASALPLIGTVDRSGGASGNRDHIGAYDGERDPLTTQAGGWTVGNYLFSDRDYNWGAVAPQVNHAEQICTFNSDKDNRATVSYTVTFPIGATVLIAADDRFTGQQGYVDSIVTRFAAAGTFTDTGWEVVNNESTPRSFSVFSAVLGPGTYVFVGANAGGNNFYVIGALPPPVLPKKATNPTPADDTMVYADSVTLMWDAGASAALHDVYVTTSFSDVNTADSSDPMGADKVYKARQSETKYPPGEWDTIPVTWGKTYYWRIDEVNGVNIWRGDIWSFEVVSNLNWNPTPPHQARFVPVTTDLSWSKGALALAGHIIYLSTDFATVNNAVPGTTTGVPGYLPPTPPETVTSLTRTIPGDLLKGTTYYWRADAVETSAPMKAYKGAVWEFETMPDIPITDPALIGWWTFDEGVGETAIDWSGHGNHGAIAGGAQRAPGHSEEAINLNGSNQYVTVPNSTSLNLTKDFTIGAWVYPDVVSGFRGIVTKCEGSTHKQYIFTVGDGQLRFEYELSGNNYAMSGGTVTAGEWQHAAVTIDSLLLVNLYIDGVSVASETAPGEVLAQSNPVAIGRWSGTYNSNYFDGLIDDVRVYNKALSVGEIRILAGLLEAYDPLPADQASGVSTTPTLDWLPGARAASHNVYFGTVYADVKAGTGGTFKGNQPLGDTDYVPSPALTAGKLYYWKITEVNDLHADKKWEGPVWVFRVAGGAGGLLGAYYQHTGGAAPAGFETFKLSRIDPEINFGWGDGSPDPLVDINDFSCRWTGQVEAPFSEDYIFYTASDDGARLWVDGQLVIDHWVDQGGTEWPSSPVALVAGQKYDIVMEQYENEGGATAYLRWSSPSTSKRIIPPIWLWPPTKATNPVPSDGSTGAPLQPTLSWTAGAYAAAANGHKVYFDADEAKVIARAGCQVNGTSATNPSYLLPWTFGLEETYYWAVDEVNGVKSWPGDLWTFTTANNKVVDDMEKYVPGVASPSIYQRWIDGAGDCDSIPGNNSGALVDISTLAGLTPVHGGQQAMKLLYDNDGTVNNPCPPGLPTARLTYSKVEAQVAQLPSGIGSDWTLGGLTKALSLWFYGDPSNSIEPMWVQLTDASNNKFKVFYGKYADEDVNNMNDNTSWHEWLIDLADFTGVTVSNVKSIAIGVGNETGPAGGSGALYFDDIRLYTPQCVLTRRSADFAALDYAPEASGGDCVINARELEVMTRDWLMTDTLLTGELLVQWAFNDASGLIAADSSGKGRTGAISAGTTWVNDPERGWCLEFNDGEFVLDNDANAYMNGLRAFTACCWIKAIGIGTDLGFISFDSPNGDDRRDIRHDAAGSSFGGTNLLKCGITATDGYQEYESSSAVQTTFWQHVALVWSQGNDIKLYFDGVIDQPATGTGGPVQAAPSGTTTGYTQMLVGKGSKDAASTAGWNGLIDDVRVYSFALTPAEIATVKAGGSLPSRPLHYPTPSPAEIGGNEAQGSMVINFKDYTVLADRWLEEELYP